MGKPTDNPFPKSVVIQGDSAGGCSVDPGSIKLGNGPTTIQWENRTNGYVEILIPDRGKPGSMTYLRIPPKQTGRANVPELDDGPYIYRIYSHEFKCYAVGGSEPEMIVP